MPQVLNPSIHHPSCALCSPQGYYCSTSAKTASASDKYNRYLGIKDTASPTCATCDPLTAVSSGSTIKTRYTSYEGFAYCTIPYVEVECGEPPGAALCCVRCMGMASPAQRGRLLCGRRAGGCQVALLPSVECAPAVYCPASRRLPPRRRPVF